MYLEVFRAFKFLSDKSQQANWQNWHTNWRMYGIGPAAEKLDFLEAYNGIIWAQPVFIPDGHTMLSDAARNSSGLD